MRGYCPCVVGAPEIRYVAYLVPLRGLPIKPSVRLAFLSDASFDILSANPSCLTANNASSYLSFHALITLVHAVPASLVGSTASLLYVETYEMKDSFLASLTLHSVVCVLIALALLIDYSFHLEIKPLCHTFLHVAFSVVCAPIIPSIPLRLHSKTFAHSTFCMNNIEIIVGIAGRFCHSVF